MSLLLERALQPFRLGPSFNSTPRSSSKQDPSQALSADPGPYMELSAHQRVEFALSRQSLSKTYTYPNTPLLELSIYRSLVYLMLGYSGPSGFNQKRSVGNRRYSLGISIPSWYW